MKFFKAYKTYMENTEPPKNFHVWTGLGVISACLGKKCYIPMGHFTIHPNLYIVLVGPAGTMKSSAMNVGKGILRALPDFPVAPASITREALLMTLGDNEMKYEFQGRTYKYHQASAFVTELQEFIGGKHINQAMVGIMTALWDEPEFEYKTANKKEIVIPSPYFTLVGCCTNDWVTTKLKSDVISDGFTRRVIFVLEDDPAEYVPWPQSSARKEAAHDVMVAEAARMHQMIGKFRFTDAALELWNTMYVKIREEAKSKDAYVQNYFSTKQNLMFKVCMALSAALDNGMIVDSNLLRLVDKLFASTEANLLDVFSGMGENKLNTYSKKIFDFINEQSETASMSAISSRFYRDLTLMEMSEIIDVLKQQGLITLSSGLNSNEIAYRVVKKVSKVTKDNLFDLLDSYVPSEGEAVSDTTSIELSRMVDSKSLNMFKGNDERVAMAKSGVISKGLSQKRAKK